tara:strand:+ start:1071 stop:1493 length:423 start_codon:yes stop_codon:yes gene_type:complete
MPVKSKASATPAKATTPRKRRTRKTSTTAKATPKAVKKTPVAKPTVEEKAFDLTATELKQVEKLVRETPSVTTTTFQSGKVIAKKTELVKPSAPLIQFRDYLTDIRNRWDIHNYEIQELQKDFLNGFTILKTRLDQLEIS